MGVILCITHVLIGVCSLRTTITVVILTLELIVLVNAHCFDFIC